MEITVRKFSNWIEADEADREFYRGLSGAERLDILLQLIKHEPEQRFERVELLNSRGVEYVIVGAHSLAFHARPRYTGDIDILIRPSTENAERMAAVLRDFGFEAKDLNPSDFCEADRVVQLGRPPNRIDLLTGISGVSTDAALASKIAADLEGVPVFFLSKDLLIQNKQAVGRPQDLADLDALRDV